MHLNATGEIIKKGWLYLSTKYPNIDLHTFVVMPNHFHGILEIVTPAFMNVYTPMGNMIAYFKYLTTGTYPFHVLFFLRYPKDSVSNIRTYSCSEVQYMASGISGHCERINR